MKDRAFVISGVMDRAGWAICLRPLRPLPHQSIVSNGQV